jgi:hypothetical protein
MGLTLLIAWGSLPNFDSFPTCAREWSFRDDIAPAFTSFAGDFVMILDFAADFAAPGLEGFAALCAIFTAVLPDFLASFGACLAVTFETGFAFVLPAIIHSAQNQ